MENKKLWFRAKRYGWGWYPITWQGWFVLFAYVFIFVIFFIKIDASSHSVSDTFIGISLPAVILVGSLIAICYVKGEKPGWHWGEK